MKPEEEELIKELFTLVQEQVREFAPDGFDWGNDEKTQEIRKKFEELGL